MMLMDASELDDLESLKQLLVIERAARFAAEAKAALATAQVSGAEATIAHLKLTIEKMRRELFGSRSERGHKLDASSNLHSKSTTVRSLV